VSDLVKLRGDWHAETLANGRTIAPGEPFDRADLTPASEDGPGDSRLTEEGLIIDAQVTPAPLEGDALQSRAKALGVTGRAKMTADELREAVALAEATSGETTQPTDDVQQIGGR
jgi:hypothetical protein